jgi:hypothetical protein
MPGGLPPDWAILDARLLISRFPAPTKTKPVRSPSRLTPARHAAKAPPVSRPMSPEELAQCHDALGVPPTVTLVELERAFMKRNFALIKGRSGAADEVNPELAAERAALKAAYDKLSAHLRAQEQSAAKALKLVRGASRPPAASDSVSPRPAAGPGGDAAERKRPQLSPAHPPPPPPARTLLTPPVVAARDPADDEFILLRFDDWRVNTFVPPLLLVLTWVITISPLGFLLKGFHVWMHEFGHAVPSWLSGWRATPLPFGWTPVEQEHSNFVYYGLLLLFGILFVAGLKERKVWPMLAAVALAGLQFFMTWRLPEARKEFWMVWGGVGGEFALSTLFMLAFWVQLPEKFKWGACRYVFFLIGASAFLNIWIFWGDVYRGIQEIPFGSMINGEEDGGGDMNRLMDDYGWKKFDIRRNYLLLGRWCWVALAVMWLLFALRLNRVADWVAGKFARPAE